MEHQAFDCYNLDSFCCSLKILMIKFWKMSLAIMAKMLYPQTSKTSVSICFNNKDKFLYRKGVPIFQCTPINALKNQ